MAQFPNLAGVATNDLVEKISGGSFSPAYINWSRTLQLLRQHAPGWTVETKESADGGLLFQAPVGGYLQLRVRHEDGTVGSWVPQAIMDNRNKSISFEKITSRDITDTQRRGACLCLAYAFGLGAELWAKIKLESGWGQDDDSETAAPKADVAVAKASDKDKKFVAAVSASASKDAFVEEALSKGLSTYAIEAIIELIKGDYAKGITTVNKKTAKEVEALNAKFQPAVNGGVDSQW